MRENKDKMDKAAETIYNFIKNYCSQKTIDEFQENLKLADAKIIEIINQNGSQFEHAGATKK